MICVRCDQPIRTGEPYDTRIHHGATLAGCTNYTHRMCPDLRRPPTEPEPARPAETRTAPSHRRPVVAPATTPGRARPLPQPPP
jgi:hypothetical protein